MLPLHWRKGLGEGRARDKLREQLRKQLHAPINKVHEKAYALTMHECMENHSHGEFQQAL
ncbi:MAG: hypothetical protein CVU57_27305 [Deltaproteobacteria bacterium HGW-Deltaproteobacteria-15]|nr:MAG: hypothetical protein CVU57_27305 [Deltaproteobacteria bacterium HGW-Deltaproteobacteria-15]